LNLSNRYLLYSFEQNRIWECKRYRKLITKYYKLYYIRFRL
jgi:hypothetical protein